VGVRRVTVVAGALAWVAGATVVGVAAPAAAKGPTGVTITDPAGHSTHLPANPEGLSHGETMELAEDMGLWEAIEPRGEALPADPPVHPGREFRVEWTLLGPGDDGQVDPDDVMVIQSLYPQARGGPLVHTEAGQEVGESTTAGGWYRASSRLPHTLETLGWETTWSYLEGEPAVDPPGAPAASTLAPRTADPAPEPGRAWHARAGVRAMAAGGAVLAAFAAATGLARRRGRRGAPVAAG
jgi:hypothetical protein